MMAIHRAHSTSTVGRVGRAAACCVLVVGGVVGCGGGSPPAPTPTPPSASAGQGEPKAGDKAGKWEVPEEARRVARPTDDAPVHKVSPRDFHQAHAEDDRGDAFIASHKGAWVELTGRVDRVSTVSIADSEPLVLAVQLKRDAPDAPAEDGDFQTVTVVLDEPAPWRKCSGNQPNGAASVTVRGVVPVHPYTRGFLDRATIVGHTGGPMPELRAAALWDEFAADQDATATKYSNRQIAVSGKAIAKAVKDSGSDWYEFALDGGNGRRIGVRYPGGRGSLNDKFAAEGENLIVIGTPRFTTSSSKPEIQLSECCRVDPFLSEEDKKVLGKDAP